MENNTLKLEDKYKHCCARVTNKTKMIKSATVILCAEIERNFRELTNISINEEVDEAGFERVKKVFLHLKDMTLKQFNVALYTFGAIRNVNAHLYLCRPIYIDKELVDYFSNIIKPIKKVADGRCLTLFGMAYFLSFFALKYQIKDFCDHFFRKRVFDELDDYDNTHYAEYFKRYVLDGEFRFNKENFNDLEEALWLNNLYRNNIVSIVFELESVSFNQTHLPPEELDESFQDLLLKIPALENNNDLVKPLVVLRNSIFHGFVLFDIYKANKTNEEIELTPNYFNNTLFETREKLKKDFECKCIADRIVGFGCNILHHYCDKLLDVSNKLLDSRLNEEEKIDQRIKKTRKCFKKINDAKEEYFRTAKLFIGDNKIDWGVNKREYIDLIPRPLMANNIKIIHFSFDSGIKIGNYPTLKKEMYLIDTGLIKEYQNKINDKYLSSYELKKNKEIGPLITLYELV